MAVTASLYGYVFLCAFNKELDYDSDAWKVSLHTSSYTPAQTHKYRSDTTASEVANGNGYATGGLAISLTTPTYNTGTKVMTFGGPATSQWTASTFTARYAIIYDSTPATDATKPLLGYVDFGADQSPSAGTLTITWSSSTIATVTLV